MSATKNSPKNSWISCIGIRVRNSYPANDSDHQITSIVFVRAGLCDLCVLNLVARELCLLWLRWYFISMDEEIFCRICLFHSDISQVVFLSYRRSSREYRDLCLEVARCSSRKINEPESKQNTSNHKMSEANGCLVVKVCWFVCVVYELDSIWIILVRDLPLLRSYWSLSSFQQS